MYKEDKEKIDKPPFFIESRLSIIFDVYVNILHQLIFHRFVEYKIIWLIISSKCS